MFWAIWEKPCAPRWLPNNRSSRDDEAMMKKYFFTGLVTLLPLAVTILAVMFIVNLLTKPFLGIVTHFLNLLPIESKHLIRIISQISILVFLFLFTLSLGMIARRFFLKTFMKIGDRLMNRIPLVNKIYKTVKEIFHTLLSGDKKTFQQVVMMPFPHRGCYALGLVSQEAPKTCNESSNQELVSIFIPATPNPLTGFLLMRPRSELIYLDMRSEDAIKYIVSCGVVPPESVKEDPT
jgi:uncharacterized membrane protein